MYLLSNAVFVNPKNMMTNKKAFDKMRLLTTILAGAVSGILNLNQLEGPLLYLGFQVVLTLMIYVLVGGGDRYFKSTGSLWEGLGGGILLFVCIWMILVNIVYVL